MSGPLRPVPDPPVENGSPTVIRRGFAQHLPQPVGEPPTAAPLDEVSRTRLRRILIDQFGEFPTLDLHLALLDSHTGVARRGHSRMCPLARAPRTGQVPADGKD